MTARDLRETGVWALAAALLVAGTFGARPVDSAGPSRAAYQRAVQVDGCTVSATTAAAARPYALDLTLRAANPGAGARACRVLVALVRQDYSGNPMSRVVRPSDYQRTIECTTEVRLDVPGAADAVKTITLPIDARPGTPAPAPAAADNGGPLRENPLVRAALRPASAEVVGHLLANSGSGWTMTGAPAATPANTQGPAQNLPRRTETPAQVAQRAVFESYAQRQAAQMPAFQGIADALTPAGRAAPRRTVTSLYQIEVASAAGDPVVLASFPASQAWPKP